LNFRSAGIKKGPSRLALLSDGVGISFDPGRLSGNGPGDVNDAQRLAAEQCQDRAITGDTDRENSETTIIFGVSAMSSVTPHINPALEIGLCSSM
jgi:hypothetical protein